MLIYTPECADPWQLAIGKHSSLGDVPSTGDPGSPAVEHLVYAVAVAALGIALIVLGVLVLLAGVAAAFTPAILIAMPVALVLVAGGSWLLSRHRSVPG